MIGNRIAGCTFVAVAALASLSVFAGPAAAMEAPSPWWIARMNEKFPRWGAVRVRHDGRTLVLRGPSAGAEGIRAQEPVAADVRFASAAAGAADHLVPWSAIDRIDRPTKGTAYGALLGGTGGTLLAVMLGAADSEVSEVAAAGMIAGGAALGGVLGGGGVRWQRYYPPLDDGLTLQPIPESR